MHLCPDCGNALPTQNILQSRESDKARGRCSHCDKWVLIQLPSIRKKLVYLDQSFLSAACLDADTSKIEVRLLSKLKELKDQQKVFLVISDIHSRETSAIPDEHDEDRRALWMFQNDLADGKISGDWRDVFVAQHRRLLANLNSSDSFPLTDIGLADPHRWQIGIKIQLTNNWRQRLNIADTRPPAQVNKEFRSIIERQLETIPRCKDARDCLHFVRELWHKCIQQGIAARQQRHTLMTTLTRRLESGGATDIHLLEESEAPLRQIVGEVMLGLDEESALQRWLNVLDGDSPVMCASVMIRTAFEASLLWKWRTGCPPTNPNTLNKGFGLSRQNDVDHISAFVPYVDALTTDNSTLDLCEHEIVADELVRFRCKMFAAKNYDDFEAWLDRL